MQVDLNGVSMGKRVSAVQPVLLEGDGATFAITLDAGEELVAFELTLAPAPSEGNPEFSEPVISTNKGPGLSGSTSDVTWISADWRFTRSLSSIDLDTIACAEPLLVRLTIARGSSQWYAPPGPRTFTLVDEADPPQGKALKASLPDTVAERLMLEFLEPKSLAIQPVTLANPPSIRFGSAVRDVTVYASAEQSGGGPASSASGPKREVFVLAGVPAGNVVVPNLLESLRQVRLPLAGPSTITLAFKPGAAGVLGLAWTLAADRISSSFAGTEPRAKVTLELPWQGVCDAPLAGIDAAGLGARVRVLSVEVACASVPARERLLLVPDPIQCGEALGELVRPTGESAQRFVLEAPASLTGAGIYARALWPSADVATSGRVSAAGSPIQVHAALHVDQKGVPASEPLAVAELELTENDGRGPNWLDFGFPEPLDVAAGLFWLVVGTRQGELSWLRGPKGASTRGELRHRRNAGAWLSRTDSDGAALLRIRALELSAQPKPELELVLRPRGSSNDERSYPLILGADDRFASVFEEALGPGEADELIVRVRSAVASSVTLSDLRLRWHLAD